MIGAIFWRTVRSFAASSATPPPAQLINEPGEKPMKIAKALRIACPELFLALACMLTTLSHAQSAKLAQPAATLRQAPQPAITLDAPTGWDFQEHAFDARGNVLPVAPPNFRRLGEVKVGEVGAVHTLTLR